MRRKNKMSKTRKNKKTKNTTKKIGGSANNELDLLYEKRGKMESELLDIEGTIYAIETGQHLDPNKSVDVIRNEKQNIEKKIADLNIEIKKKEEAWNKKADSMISNMANNDIKNAIRRSKPNHVGVMGGTTLLLIGVVGVIFAVVKTK
jgi:hypothetical protein